MRQSPIWLVALTILSLVASCKKGEFTAFPSPMVIVLVDPAGGLDLLQDAKTSEKPLGRLQSSDGVQALGTLRLAAATFLQVKCPDRLKCENGTGYVQKDFVAADAASTGEASVAYLMDLNDSLDGGFERARQTSQWFANPRMDLPERPDLKMIQACLGRMANADARLERSTELLYVFSALSHPATIKDASAPLVKRYRVLARLAERRAAEERTEQKGDRNAEAATTQSAQQIAEAARQAGGPTTGSVIAPQGPTVPEKDLAAIQAYLKKRNEDDMKAMLEGFAFRNPTWKGLATEYNNLSASVYLREQVLAKILETGEYFIEAKEPRVTKDTNEGKDLKEAKDAGAGAGEPRTTKQEEWKIEIRPLDGVFLVGRTPLPAQTSAAPGDPGSGGTVPATHGASGAGDALRILSTKATAVKNGLAIEIQTDRGMVKIVPKEIPPFLAKGGPGLEQIVADIPANWQKIVDDNDFSRAALLIALKFGAPPGESAYKDGRLTFRVTTEDWKYWMMFALLKKSPHMVVEGKGFNGRFDVGSGSALYQYGQAVEAWYQPPGEFRIQYRWIGGRGGQSEMTESTCFAKDGATPFHISFEPAEIHRDHPRVRIALGEEGDQGICSTMVTALNEAE